MSLLRNLSLLVVPFVSGCIDSPPPPIDYSPGFFDSFDIMVDNTNARGTDDTKATTFAAEFNRRVNDGPSPVELYAVGPTWDKVRAFLDIGILSAEVMATVNDSAHPRVDIFADAADRVLRSDYVAITSWNQSVDSQMTIQPTAEIVWESLYLVLTESGHAERKVSTAKGEWVEGYWTRGPDEYKSFWVPGYYESVWRDGTCRDNYVRTDCSSYWVPETCSDVWIDDGYWESYCSGYDDNGDCVEWTDEWVDTGYYESQCAAEQYVEDCTDVYQTVCDPGQWLDIWIAAHRVEGAAIPGRLSWVEKHLAEAASERFEALPEQEATILALGIEYVLSFGPDYVQGTCFTNLEAARSSYDVETPEVSIKASRDAIVQCLSQH
jgi:hypothetical protein